MAERKGLILLLFWTIALSLGACGFSIAAEHRRSTGSILMDEKTGEWYCVYKSNAANGYGVGASLILLASQSLIMVITKCMCFGKPLAPGSSRIWSIMYFSCSWMTFLVAEALIIAGAKKNPYHTKHMSAMYAQNGTCETLPKGVFIAGAVFVVVTMILNVFYCIYFVKATTQITRTTENSTVEMTTNP